MDKLKKVYLPKDKVALAQLQTNLLMCFQKKNETLSKFISRLCHINNKFTTLGTPSPPEACLAVRDGMPEGVCLLVRNFGQGRCTRLQGYDH
jgi:hypothetical protein